MIRFKNSTEFIEEIDHITGTEQTHVKFGIPFLDDALDGLFADDLVIITAQTGGGKTETATTIAYNAAKSGKKVYFFALEAHRAEIESRIKFKLLAQAFYTQLNWKEESDVPDYQKWIHGKQTNLLVKFNAEVNEIMKKDLKTLNTFYGDHEFTTDMFDMLMGQIGEDADLVMLDHPHHINLPGENENLEFKRMIRQMKKIVTFYRKPMLLVAQLRKLDKYSGALLPSADDIYGASELQKIATRIIATAPARDVDKASAHVFPTYFKILKNRKQGSRTFYAALCGYDSVKNEYIGNYKLGLLKKNDTKFEEIESWHYPRWAKLSQSLL